MTTIRDTLFATDFEAADVERWENEGGSYRSPCGMLSHVVGAAKRDGPRLAFARRVKKFNPKPLRTESRTMTAVRDLDFETHNDLPTTARESMIDLLNNQLADTIDMQTQAKQAHWNVKGMNFMPLHLYFDDLSSHFIRYADLIAERATALGGRAQGSVRLVAEYSRIDELPIDLSDGMDFVLALAKRVAEYAASTRAAIERSAHQNDAVTSDLFTEICREVDKDLWFLESHLQS